MDFIKEVEAASLEKIQDTFIYREIETTLFPPSKKQSIIKLWQVQAIGEILSVPSRSLEIKDKEQFDALKIKVIEKAKEFAIAHGIEHLIEWDSYLSI